VSRVPLERLAPRLREILEVALYQIRHLDRVPDYAAVSEAVKQARGSGGEGASKLINGVLRGILLLPPPAPPRLPLPAREGWDEGNPSASVLSRHFSHPLFLVERWLARLGPERTRRILEADNAASAMDLMVNPRRLRRDALAEALQREGIETSPSPLTPLGLTVRSGNPLQSPRFAAGDFTVQDLGSQALPLLLPPGRTLVDLAAAPGGKSFAAIALGRALRAVALDRSLERLRLLEQNRVRLGMPEVTPVASEVTSAPLPSGRFDRVLFDAPCSGTGTLRKSPEIRYRVTPESIERLAAAQETGLLAAATLLAPGGFLLYATCSLEEEENERVVSRVLERDPRLELAPIVAPEGLRPFVSGAVFRLFPDADADGFTGHLLRRKA
jgi:16S rRNA (cytosine967-C5)-methyltransferase